MQTWSRFSISLECALFCGIFIWNIEILCLYNTLKCPTIVEIATEMKTNKEMCGTIRIFCHILSQKKNEIFALVRKKCIRTIQHPSSSSVITDFACVCIRNLFFLSLNLDTKPQNHTPWVAFAYNINSLFHAYTTLHTFHTRLIWVLSSISAQKNGCISFYSFVFMHLLGSRNQLFPFFWRKKSDLFNKNRWTFHWSLTLVS